MPNPFKPIIKSHQGGNVRVTTSNAKLSGLSLEVSPLGVTDTGSQAPIKLNGLVDFNLSAGKWVFRVIFQNVNAQASLDIDVSTPSNPSTAPLGPIPGLAPQYDVGLVSFLVYV